MNSNIALKKAALCELEDDSILGLRNGFNLVLRYRGLIAAITLTVTAMGGVYALVRKPVYEGNMLIQVAPRPPGERKHMLGEVGATFDQGTTASSEAGVLRSRAVIGNVVTALRYHIDVRPKGASIFGSPGDADRMSVTEFEVPQSQIDRDFTVTLIDAGRFRLSDEKGKVDAVGSIGAPLDLQLPAGRLRLHIAAIDARPGTQFLVTRKSDVAVVEDIQESLIAAETAKDTGLISVSLRGADPAAIHALLSGIANEYLRQYQLRRSRSARAAKGSLDSQLPTLKQRMEDAESKLNAFRDQHGTADLAEETRLQVQRLAASEQSLLELSQKKSELLVRFGTAHPAVSGMDDQISLVRAEKNALATRVRRLPLIEQELGRLARDVKVATDVYSNVLRTAQELSVISVEQADNVRLADAPVIPRTPVNPRSTTVVLASALGLLLGLLGAFMKQLLATR